MISAEGQAQAVGFDAGADLAVHAWERLCLQLGHPAVPPTAIVRLKRQRREWHKSAVYRLEGVGDRGSAVIAKRCIRSTAQVERDVYEKLLPRIPVTQLRYHGFLEEDEKKFCWLFLEDAGSTKPTMADREVIGEWLARLHGGAASLPATALLPDRGPDYYLGILPTAHAGLITAREVASRSGHDCQVLETLSDALDLVEARWDRVSAACAASPRTLVHADFTGKNVRVRQGNLGTQVLALDWENAGWGSPAADLAHAPWRRPRNRAPSETQDPEDARTPWYRPVSLDAYASTIKAFWPRIGRREIERLSRVGSIFRVIDGICWAATIVQFGGIDKGLGRLQAYAEDLLPAAAALDE